MATEGKRQSPIDIATSKAASDSGLKKAPLKWSYTPANCKTIENTGASFMVAADGAGSSECDKSGGWDVTNEPLIFIQA